MSTQKYAIYNCSIQIPSHRIPRSKVSLQNLNLPQTSQSEDSTLQGLWNVFDNYWGENAAPATAHPTPPPVPAPAPPAPTVPDASPPSDSPGVGAGLVEGSTEINPSDSSPSGDGEDSSSAGPSGFEEVGDVGMHAPTSTSVVAELEMEPLAPVETNADLVEIPSAEIEIRVPPALHDSSDKASATSSLAERSEMCPASKEERRKELTAKIDLLRRVFWTQSVCQHHYVVHCFLVERKIE